MTGERNTTSFMPTFDEVMQEHEQLQKWGKPKPQSQPVDYDTHMQTHGRLFGTTRGKGVVGGDHTPDPLF